MEDFFAGVANRWPAGREDYCWLVLPDAEAAQECLLAPYSELTGWPGLVPVRAEWVHIIVQHLAPAAEIGGAELGKITRRVQGRCAGIAPITVTAGRAEAWETGVVCPVRPGYMLRFLRQVTEGVGREVTGSGFGASPSAYYPHLTLAYAVASMDPGPVRAWLSDCEAGEMALEITRLVLAAQQHDGREITWRVIDEVALTGNTP